MPPAASDTSLVMSERTAPPQNRRSTIHANDSENMLVEAVGTTGWDAVVFSTYALRRWPHQQPHEATVDAEERFRLTGQEAFALYQDLGKYLARRGFPILLTTAKAGERAA